MLNEKINRVRTSLQLSGSMVGHLQLMDWLLSLFSESVRLCMRESNRSLLIDRPGVSLIVFYNCISLFLFVFLKRMTLNFDKKNTDKSSLPTFKL